MKSLLIKLFTLLASVCYAQVQIPEIQWERTYGGSQNEDLNAILPLGGGRYILGGSTESHNGDVQSGNYQSRDLWIIEINTSGEIIWEKTYGGSGTETLCAIEKTIDGGYIVGTISNSTDGDIQSDNLGGYDVWIFKIDNLGNILWGKLLGGNHHDHIKSIKQTNDGGYIIAGSTRSGILSIQYGTGGYWDFWIFKIDSEGEVIWDRQYGGDGYEALTSFCSSPDGGYFLTGRKRPGNSNENIWVIKINNSGEVEWERTFGGTKDDYAWTSIGDTEGNLYFGGITYSNDLDVQSGNKGKSDIWVLKIDPSGKLLWEKTLGGSNEDDLHSIWLDQDENLFLGGSTRSDDGDIRSGNHGDWDFWLVNLNANGDLLWEKTYGGMLLDISHCIISPSQNSFLVGGITNSNDGDINSGNEGMADIWLLNFGSLPDVEPPTSPSGLLSQNVTVNSFEIIWEESSDNIGVAGYKIFVNDLLIGTSIDNSFSLYGLNPGTNYKIQITAYDESSNESQRSDPLMVTTLDDNTGIFEEDNMTNTKIRIFPNPIDNHLTIELNHISNYYANITNLNGKILIEKEIAGQKHNIDLSSFKKGVYFITIRSRDFVTTRKIVKL